MVKQCTVCNRSYHGSLVVCPHCLGTEPGPISAEWQSNWSAWIESNKSGAAESSNGTPEAFGVEVFEEETLGDTDFEINLDDFPAAEPRQGADRSNATPAEDRQLELPAMDFSALCQELFEISGGQAEPSTFVSAKAPAATVPQLALEVLPPGPLPIGNGDYPTMEANDPNRREPKHTKKSLNGEEDPRTGASAKIETTSGRGAPSWPPFGMRSNIRRLHAGLWGALLATLACVGIWAFGLVPLSPLQVAKHAAQEQSADGQAELIPFMPQPDATEQRAAPDAAKTIHERISFYFVQAMSELLANNKNLRDSLETARAELKAEKDKNHALALTPHRQNAKDLAVQQAALSQQARDEVADAKKIADQALATAAALEKRLTAAQEKLKEVEGKLKETTSRTMFSPGADTTSPRPVSLPPPPANPQLAYQAYSKGLLAYQQKKFLESETEFLVAVQSDDQDARYHYYLGLTRLALDKREQAAENFRQGARLERENKPSRIYVVLALEQISKEARQTLAGYRPK